MVDNFTEDDAMREIVADLTGEMLYYDQETLNRLVAEQPTLWQRIANWFDNIIAKFNGINDPEIEQMKQTRAMFETALQEAKQGNGDTRYSLPGKKGSSLLSNEEYGRLQSNLFDAKHRGYRFEPRLNGGYMVDMGNLLVYTNKRGTPEHVLEINVAEGDTFTENDIVQDAISLEKEGYDNEAQRIILQGIYGEECAYFRDSGYVPSAPRQTPRRTGRDAGAVGEGNRGEVPAEGEVSDGKVKYSLVTPEQDAEYMKAAEAKDEDTAAWMVRTAAKETGKFFSNKRGYPINLYHGTKRFGWTEFDTEHTGNNLGDIWTTSNRSVASGYSEFGHDRGASSKYIPDDGTDATIIKNAHNVLNQDYRRATTEDIVQKYDQLVEEFKAIREKVVDSYDEMYAPPDEIASQFWNIMNDFENAVDNDADGYGSGIGDYIKAGDIASALNEAQSVDLVGQRSLLEQLKEVKAYYNNNENALNDLKRNAPKTYALLFRGYDLGDAVIDFDYGYRQLFDENLFASESTGKLTTRESLQNAIKQDANRGNYTLFGEPGDKPFEVDANNSFWLNIKVPEIGDDVYSTDSIVKWAKDNGYTSVVIRNVMDPGVVNVIGDDYVFFNPNQIKSADPITYDDNGNVIPLSERFNDENNDIRYSLPVQTADGKTVEGVEYVDGNRDSVAQDQYSLTTWRNSTNKEQLVKTLQEAGFKNRDIRKWMDDIDSVASVIAASKNLDYTAYNSDSNHFMRNNQEYFATLDASTLCAKRLIYQGTFNAIQERLKNTPLLADDIVRLRQMMKEAMYETPCAICYVESRRKDLGKYAKDFLDLVKREQGKTIEELKAGDINEETGKKKTVFHVGNLEYVPTVYDLTTTDGLTAMMEEHPETAAAWTKFASSKGSANPKVVQRRTAYDNDIARLTDSVVEAFFCLSGI